MRITVVPADRLSPEHLAAWSGLQQTEPTLDSPFFRPEFTQALASVRGDVEVAVLEEGGGPAGFFPFHRRGWGVGKPVGGPLNDFQGVIARPDLKCTGRSLVRACGLSAWDFDHLVAAQAPFAPYHYAVDGSRYLDLSGGFEAFLTERGQSGTRTIKELMRKRRKLEREKGEVRFEYHTTEPEVFQALLAWKRDQYRRTRVTDVFAFPWTVRLLDRVLTQPQELFAAKLSALFVDGRPVAIELGLRSGSVLHGWFPTYDPSFGHYSPGLILLLEIAREAAARGVGRLDMGKGPGQYKESFSSGMIPLAEGSVTLSPFRRLTRRGTHRARVWARGSRFGLPVRAIGRWTRSLRGWLKFR